VQRRTTLLQFLRSSSPLAHTFESLASITNIAVAVIRDRHFKDETEDFLHLLVFTVALPWLTARRAATIEPTMQEPISKIKALKNRPPSNSTTLSSIRTSLVCSSGCPEHKFTEWGTDCREDCVLRSSQLSERSSLAPQRTQSGRSCRSMSHCIAATTFRLGSGQKLAPLFDDRNGSL
jgi:hypothetical protein